MTLRSYPESPELAQVIDELASHGPELLPELDGALRAGLLSESPAGLAFRHEPMREAIYHDLAPPLRQGIHREVASALTAAGVPAVRLADHLFLGACATDPESLRWLCSSSRVPCPTRRSPDTRSCSSQRSSSRCRSCCTRRRCGA